MLKALSRKMMTSEWGVERMLGGGGEEEEVEGNEKPRAGNKLNLDRQHFGRRENALL